MFAAISSSCEFNSLTACSFSAFNSSIACSASGINEPSSSAICSSSSSAVTSLLGVIAAAPMLPIPDAPPAEPIPAAPPVSPAPLAPPAPVAPPAPPVAPVSSSAVSSPVISSRPSAPIILVIRFIKKSSIEISSALPSSPATLASSASLNFPSPSSSNISNTLSAPHASINAWNAGDCDAIFSNSSRSAPTRSSVFNVEPSAFVWSSSSVSSVLLAFNIFSNNFINASCSFVELSVAAELFVLFSVSVLSSVLSSVLFSVSVPNFSCSICTNDSIAFEKFCNFSVNVSSAFTLLAASFCVLSSTV